MYGSIAEGLGGISAKVVADSQCEMTRLTTLELTYPRFIHAEFMTHRMFSRNASSSRAIPVEKMLGSLEAEPVHWGQNEAGMQARTELSPADMPVAQEIWKQARDSSVRHARELLSLDMHKQVVNRITEPYQFIHVVVTATEWENFFNLRLHPDAQPEIQELAKCIKEVMDDNVASYVEHDQWHLPYVQESEMAKGTLEDLQKASVARCARVSYRNHDNSEPDISKDIELHDMLLEAGHMSPFEHQGKPMPFDPIKIIIQEEGNGFWMNPGVTHFDKFGQAWSGNFKDWIQLRQTLEVADE